MKYLFRGYCRNVKCTIAEDITRMICVSRPLSESTDCIHLGEAQTTETKMTIVVLESVFHRDRISMLGLFLRFGADRKKQQTHKTKIQPAHSLRFCAESINVLRKI